MLILGTLILLLLGFIAAAFLALRLLQLLSFIGLVVLAAAGMGALILGAIAGLIAALVLQATITANAPLLSIAGGLLVMLWVTYRALRRMLWEVRTARQRLWGKSNPSTQRLPSQQA